MNQFSFQYPVVFAVLILFVICAKWCKERSRAIYFPHIHNMLVPSVGKSTWLDLLKWLGIILAVTALASPVITKSYNNSKKEGRDIVLVLDASDSMRQRGFDPNNIMKSKFDVVKEVVEDFIEKRKDDRMGMVTFADAAFIASPLTFEKDFLKNITKMQQLGIAGQRTAINDALVQAYNMLDKSKAKSKIVLLLTDGRDNMSKVSFNEVRQMISKRNTKLYAIGIGDNRDYDGPYLQALAEAGKGAAFGARNARMLKEVYRQIDKLETSKLNDKKIVEHTYLYIYPLIVAILSLLLFVYFRNVRSL